ncbi:MAG: hypothetical protein GY778_31065 [bacterium]|nr:hypothetical protein [bacterium]
MRRPIVWTIRSVWWCSVGVAASLLPTGCDGQSGLVPSGGTLNPFRDLPAIERDGQEHDVTSEIVPLGRLEVGDALRVNVSGEAVDAVLILFEDDRSDRSGLLAGGGPANEAFSYRAQSAGQYYAYLQIDGGVSEARRRATIAVRRGSADYQPPQRQVMQVSFEDDFLTGPGLFDPESGDDEELQFLEDITPLVRDEILRQLRQTFEGTPVEIIDEFELLPDEPVARLVYRPDRVLAEDPDLVDVALPPPDPTRPECQTRVVFGEVLPRGTRQDPGNAILDDEASVYVGSFQGRGENCRTSIVNSLNNVAFVLAQTGAHEIGHLVGLYHVAQLGLMNRSAMLSFRNDLAFARGQVLVDVASGALTLTTVIQDPEFYFRAAFDNE